MRPSLPIDMGSAIRAELERTGSVPVAEVARVLARSYRELDDLIEVMLAREVMRACARQGLTMRIN